jgi:5,10-methylenetetrahydromethanopterin reductase
MRPTTIGGRTPGPAPGLIAELSVGRVTVLAMTAWGVCFPREFPASEILPCARAVEAAGAEDLWLVEDCFFTTATSLAAAALTGTERLRVGLGILPAVTRNAAFTAMELATLAGLAPGRLIGGIGHGLQEWMEQIGVRQASPLTALTEVLEAVRALLRGERVDVEGRFVRLRDVTLEHPPQPVPPVLAGVFGPKSLALAGRHADGVILADWPVPDHIRSARRLADRDDGFEVAIFAPTSVDRDRSVARGRVVEELASAIRRESVPLGALPFFGELAARVRSDGPDGLLGLPDDWWWHLGAIGTPDDVAAHVDAVTRAGADRVALVLGPERTSWWAQFDLLRGTLAGAGAG